jgi:very-short-patch-repair endonuclease
VRRAPELPDGLLALARSQQRVVTRRQLVELGLNQFQIRAQLRARRWTEWGSHVLLLHNSEPTRPQRMWAALLDAGEPAALVSHTALELWGFRSFASEAADLHLVVPRGAKVRRWPGLVVHESRRVQPDEHVLRDGLRCTPAARSMLDAAAWQPWPRFACALLAAVVQQRLCDVDQVDEALQRIGRIRHKAYLREALREVAGGAEAVSELDLARLCRRQGLLAPARQVRRRSADGRWRYLDAEWVLPDGQRIVLEVDGAHHLDVEHWQADMRRDRSLVAGGAVVLRATALELRLEPEVVAADLVAAGVPRVVRRELTQRSTEF